jgi:hypothetical protein
LGQKNIILERSTEKSNGKLTSTKPTLILEVLTALSSVSTAGAAIAPTMLSPRKRPSIETKNETKEN